MSSFPQVRQGCSTTMFLNFVQSSCRSPYASHLWVCRVLWCWKISGNDSTGPFLSRVWNFIYVLFLIRQKKSSKDSRVKRLNIALWISGWNHFASHFLTWEILIQSGSHTIGNWEWRWMKSKSILDGGLKFQRTTERDVWNPASTAGLRSFLFKPKFVYIEPLRGWRNCFPVKGWRIKPLQRNTLKMHLTRMSREVGKWSNIDVFTTSKWRVSLINGGSLSIKVSTIPFVPSQNRPVGGFSWSLTNFTTHQNGVYGVRL